MPRGCSRRRRYCSGACRSKAYRERGRWPAIAAIAFLAQQARDEEWPGWERYWCPVCDDILLSGFGTGWRKDKRYCSGKCRSRAYRERHRDYVTVT